MPRGNLIKVIFHPAVIFITTLVLCYPLVFQGYISGYDSQWHVLWSQQFLRSQNLGLTYPQWVADANLGCGSATFIFYPPFTFFTYTVINFFTKQILTILSISIFLGLLFSGIVMYAFCRNYLRKSFSLISAVIYMALPYHLVDIYTRSALSELWAFVWIPAICFFMTKIREKAVSNSIGLSISYAGLILTHLPTALLFSPFLVVYIIFLFYYEGNAKFCMNRFFALLIGIGLSSFYLIPAVLEQQYVNITHLVKDKWFWIDYNFLFSREAGKLIFNRRVSRIAVSTTLLTVVCLLFGTLHRRDKIDKALLSLGSFFAVVGICSFVMMLSISKIIWDNFPFLKFVQFPWRLLSITTFLASFCTGITLEKLFNFPSPMKRWFNAAIGLFIFCVILLNGWYSFTTIFTFKSYSFHHAEFLEKQNLSIRSDASYDEMRRNYNLYFIGNLWLMDVLEYRPTWSVQRYMNEGTSDHEDKRMDYENYLQLMRKKIAESPQLDFEQEAALFYDRQGSYVFFPLLKVLRSINLSEAAIAIPYNMLKEKVIFEEGRGLIKIIRWEPETRTIYVETTEPGKILVKTFYYPRWKASIQGRPVSIKADSSTGLIELEIPPGKYEIELQFKADTYRFIGIIISMLSVGIMLFILIREKVMGRFDK